MPCNSLASSCDVVKDLGCLYVGATKTFSGQIRNSTTGKGISITGMTLSAIFSLNGHTQLTAEQVLGNSAEAAAGLWEIKLDTIMTGKFRHDNKYDVEFQLTDPNANPIERAILGLGSIKAAKRQHDD